MKSITRNIEKVDNGGFRIAWFIPVECVMFGTILGLGPKFITVLSVVLAVILVPIFVLCMGFLAQELYAKKHRQVYMTVMRLVRKPQHSFTAILQRSKRIKPATGIKISFSKPDTISFP